MVNSFLLMINNKMEISLGNKILNIQFNVFKTPNYNKLKNELSDYLSKNDICGNKIKSFELREDVVNYKIIPKEPSLEDSLYEGNYEKDIEKIGNKYGVKNLGFIHWCYHE
jgi:hypothetical protein